MDQINKVHHKNFLDNNLPDKCANLIIADPPYFEVKGNFDFIWKSFEDYLVDVEKWAIECKRLLSDNGTLLWWGMDRKIAYSQIILDKKFILLGNLVWEKPGSPNEWDTRRNFPERAAERLLMYSNDIDQTGLEKITELYIKPNNPFSLYLKEEFKKANVSNKELAKLFPSLTGGLTGCVSNWISGDNVIREDQYLKIRQYLKDEYLLRDYSSLKDEYDSLRLKYQPLIDEVEENRRHFNNSLKLTDVLKFSRTTKSLHPTQKPERLTRALIQTCSKPNSLVIIPFAGSGTECAMSILEGRKFYGYEIEKRHVDTANKRVNEILYKPQLF